MSSTEGEENDATESRSRNVNGGTGANDNIHVAASGVDPTDMVLSAAHVAISNSVATSKTSTTEEASVHNPAAHEATANTAAAHEATANTAAAYEATANTAAAYEATVNISAAQETAVNTSAAQETTVNTSTARETAVNTSTAQETTVNTSTAQETAVNTSPAQETTVNTSPALQTITGTSTDRDKRNIKPGIKPTSASKDNIDTGGKSNPATQINAKSDGKPITTTKENAKCGGKTSTATRQHAIGCGAPSTTTKQNVKGGGNVNTATKQHPMGGGAPSTTTKQNVKGGGNVNNATKDNVAPACSQGLRNRDPAQFSSPDSSDSLDYSSAIKKCHGYESRFRQRGIQRSSPSTPPQPPPRSGLKGVSSTRPVPVPRSNIPPSTSRGRGTGPVNNSGPSTSGHPDTSAGSQRHPDTAIVWSSSSDSSDELYAMPYPKKKPKKGKCNDSMRPCGVYRTPGGGTNPNEGEAESPGEHAGVIHITSRSEVNRDVTHITSRSEVNRDVIHITSRSEVNRDVTRIDGRRQISLRMSGRCKYCINIHDIGNDSRNDWRTRVDSSSDSSDDTNNVEGWSSRADGGSVRSPDRTGYTSVDDAPEMSDAELVLWVLEQRRAQRQSQQESRRHARREAQLDYERDAHVIRRRPVPTPRGISRGQGNVRHSGGNTEVRPRRTILGSLTRGVRRLGASLSRCCQPCQ